MFCLDFGAQQSITEFWTAKTTTLLLWGSFMCEFTWGLTFAGQLLFQEPKVVPVFKWNWFIITWHPYFCFCSNGWIAHVHVYFQLILTFSTLLYTRSVSCLPAYYALLFQTNQFIFSFQESKNSSLNLVIWIITSVFRYAQTGSRRFLHADGKQLLGNSMVCKKKCTSSIVFISKEWLLIKYTENGTRMGMVAYIALQNIHHVSGFLFFISD
jgi:hypothetical protein